MSLKRQKQKGHLYSESFQTHRKDGGHREFYTHRVYRKESIGENGVRMDVNICDEGWHEENVTKCNKLWKNTNANIPKPHYTQKTKTNNYLIGATSVKIFHIIALVD